MKFCGIPAGFHWNSTITFGPRGIQQNSSGIDRSFFPEELTDFHQYLGIPAEFLWKFSTIPVESKEVLEFHYYTELKGFSLELLWKSYGTSGATINSLNSTKFYLTISGIYLKAKQKFSRCQNCIELLGIPVDILRSVQEFFVEFKKNLWIYENFTGTHLELSETFEKYFELEGTTLI